VIPLLLALAADFYVDPAVGLDSNPGTKALPLRTLAFASSVAADDDRIFLQPGVYSASSNGETFPIVFGGGASQQNLEVVGVAGASATIVDGEGAANSANGMLHFQAGAAGARLAGLTVKGYAGPGGAIRIGTFFVGTSNVEVESCVVRDCLSGSGILAGGDSSGVLLHGNLLVELPDNGIWVRSESPGSPGGGAIFHNTIADGNNNGVRFQGGTWTFVNNVVFSNGSRGLLDCFFLGPGCVTAPPGAFNALTVDFNDVFGNLVDYVGVAPGSNDVSVDPLFVDPANDDYHLQATSPLVDLATPAIPSSHETDVDRDPRALDGDGNQSPLPDVGADEVAKYRLVLLSGGLKQGSSATFDLTGPVGDLGLVFFSANTANFVVPPFGTVLFDPTILFGVNPLIAIGGPPATVGPIPVSPVLSGFFVYSQAVVLDLATLGLGQTTNRVDNQL
jgi:hypothetical protein